MSDRRDRNKWKKHFNTWKLIDQRSGFEIRSDQACIDENGYVVSKNNCDPKDMTNAPIYFAPERALPFVRPEPKDRFITVTEVVIGTPQVWYQIGLDWDNWGVNWGTSTLSTDVEE